MFLTSCKACLSVYNIIINIIYSTMRTLRFRPNASLNWFQLVPETNKKRSICSYPQKSTITHVIYCKHERLKKRLIFFAAGFITCLLMDWHHTSKINWPNRLEIPSIILICNIFAKVVSLWKLKKIIYMNQYKLCSLFYFSQINRC